ncbi:MAG: PP2C family protein-serine/threonine phosphatase [Chloroflexi bacterium]|jgi:serine phosphatase RsbU (regulator of sigma subunit)|nr:PP2C family protein-serine/threonine phosphatase [Chloroflexota bacterium]
MFFKPRATIPKRYKLLLAVARILRPEINAMQIERQVVAVGDLISFLYAAPLAIAGIIWLIRISDWQLWRAHSAEIVLQAVLFFIFNYLRFFLIVELRANRYGSSDGSLAGIILWSGILLFGPTLLWLAILGTLFEFWSNWRNAVSDTARWSQYRNLAINIAGNTLVSLTALTIYIAIGGTYPLSPLSTDTVSRAFGLLALNFALLILLWSGYLLYGVWSQRVLAGSDQINPVLKFFFLAMGLPHMAHPFAILAAGLYAEGGIPVYLFFVSGMLIVAYLTRQLSWSGESSRQQSRMLEHLERLGRAIIDAPPHTENLPAILEAHIPNMFPAGRYAIWIFPEDTLVKYPLDWQPDLDAIWPWLLDQEQGQIFQAQDELPWQNSFDSHNPMVLSPIKEGESGQTFGGVYLELYALAQPWDRQALQNLCPAVQALGAQIASAINQARVYEQTLEYQRVREELKLAGQIQSSLLPSVFPKMPGWQLSVTLAPAGETSGDFFDVIPLEGGRVGIVLADVLDKGIGPALYMALSRTLIRTYATEFELQPDVVFFATNERILKDTRANLFVTAFYGILDPQNGTLTYANAGHNPPLLLRAHDEGNTELLQKTGLPIGIDEEATWEHNTVEIFPGDVLVLYTDGIPEAQNTHKELFKRDALEAIARANLQQSAEGIQKEILDAVYDFLGEIAPQDDITLMVLLRDNE